MHSIKKPLIFLGLLLILGTVGTTFAYFYAEVVVPNQFRSMTYNVTVEEEFYDDWGTKIVKFVNKEKSNTPVVLRINYNEFWRDTEDGVTYSLDNNFNGENVVEKRWTLDFTNNFIYGDDGWYYYKRVLNAEESVQVLESIALKNDLIFSSVHRYDYYTYDYELDFNYEAIQADEKAISNLWGYDAIIEEDEVVWYFSEK